MLDFNISFSRMDEKGNIIKYSIVDRFTKNNKNYIIYKEEGKEELHADLYETSDDKLIIIPIKDQSDYDIVDRYLESLWI